MTLDTVEFEGRACVRIDGDTSAVLLTTSVGPRILGLVGRTGNLLAVVPDAGLDGPDGIRVRLYGGHRLWAAPEEPAVTYQPDDRPCTVQEVDGGVRVSAPVDGVGLEKTIQVRETSRGWTVDHEIRNAGEGPMTLAAWAITQLRLGGEAELPAGPWGVGLQADRSVVLWPYSDPEDPRVRISREGIRIRAVARGPALKFGVAPSEGRVRYHLDGDVFEKRVEVDPNEPHADRGAAVQVYLCDDFCELETLGPLRTVEPGGSATHREIWTLAGDPR